MIKTICLSIDFLTANETVLIIATIHKVYKYLNLFSEYI